MMRRLLGAGRKLKDKVKDEERREEDEDEDEEETDARDDSDGDSDYKEEPSQNDGDEFECWAEWLKRTTFLVEDICSQMELEDWVAAQRKRKWQFAGHVSRRDDGRWNTQTLDYGKDGSRRAGIP